MGLKSVSTNHKSSVAFNWIIFIRSRFIQLLVILTFDPTSVWPTDPPNIPTHPPMGGGVSTNHKSSNRIELPRLGQDSLKFLEHLTWPHPLTHSSTLPTHTPSHGLGCHLQIINLQTELNYLDSVKNCAVKFLVIWPLTPPINLPTHPPTHQIYTLNSWAEGRLHRFQILQTSIEISQLVQVLLNFEWFQGSPGAWGGGWMGWEVVRGLHPTQAVTHMHMHVHAHDAHPLRMRRYVCHREFPGIPPMGWPFAWNYHVYHAYMCMCVHVWIRVHVHCVGAPPNQTTPHPQEPQETWKHQIIQ